MLFAPYRQTVTPVLLMYSRETAACRQTQAVYKLDLLQKKLAERSLRIT